jgi:hypothetical protein
MKSKSWLNKLELQQISNSCVVICKGVDQMLFLGGLLVIGVGLLNIFYPSFAWYLKEGWKVAGDSEPSDTYLFLTKIGGGIATLMGIVVFLSGFV